MKLTNKFSCPKLKVTNFQVFTRHYRRMSFHTHQATKGQAVPNFDNNSLFSRSNEGQGNRFESMPLPRSVKVTIHYVITQVYNE